MPVFKASNFPLFHVNESQFHFFFEIGFNVTKSVLKSLIVFKAQPLLLYRQTTFIFLMQLCFNRRFHLAFAIFELPVLLNIMLVSKRIDFSLQTQVQFLTNP